jgi:small subunit ribosomal protein S3
MGRKINPRGYRLGITTDFRTHWYSDSKKTGDRYRDYVAEDVKIRKTLKENFARAGISKIDLERTRNRIRIDIHTAKPGIVIGRRGSEVDQVRFKLEKETGKQIQLNVLEVKNPNMDAQLVAQGIAEQLENRASFRRAMRTGMSAALVNGALGIKVKVSGRLGGAEMSRSEFYHEKQVPLQTLKANIDYGFYEAHTTYGRLGIKVWIYKGDLTEREWEALQLIKKSKKPRVNRKDQNARTKKD